MPDNSPILVTPDNFVRAESDLYFANIIKNENAFARFMHNRAPAPIDHQNVIRLNRDTLYSAIVLDLDAGPAAVTLPDAGRRFMSVQVINEDQYTLSVTYGAGARTLTRDAVGTRYVVVAIRTLADPNDPADLAQVAALQDAMTIDQPGDPGRFEIPQWDKESQDKVRAALLTLASTLPDTKGMFGPKDQVDPVRRLIGAAMGWGGNPESEALYLNVTPEKNDGKTVYRLKVGEVPVDGFWSISLYNAEGYFAPNPQNAYSVNSITAKPDADGGVTIQFGGCDGVVPNCLPIMPGWNYLVRLYRPRPEVLSGAWTFPSPQAV
ncbi:MAG: carboxylesterase [Phenylobacterium sp.]|uniref:DUF1214 domain-containing protein n=1 Tax=Phenylobacterium sp. TaxID=1871053 RepID=UPI0025F5659D|nr:DUF1254 domain-containing protein [Phenylobacterium sp.]MBA4012183.1 carboxylesterase [Phenylobacterium sp.]